ncbi:hypothetical protein FI667_g2385, partial [Globisporangium splendens]
MAAASPNTSEDDSISHDVLFEQQYSPFAATRVVGNSACPAWNELLTLALPFDWRETNERFSLRLELVQRSPSQQENFLMATAILPLQCIACDHQQVRIALQFPVATPNSAETASAKGMPRIWISLRETSQSCFSSPTSPHTTSSERLEVLIESFAPVSEAHATLPESLALALTVNRSRCDSESLEEELAQLFDVWQDQHAIVAAAPSENPLVSLTPYATQQRHLDMGGDYRWHFPLSFEIHVGHDESSTPRLEFSVYDTSSTAAAQIRIGRGSFELLQEMHQARDGARVRLQPPVLIHSCSGDASSTPILLGHSRVSVRWWSAAAWGTFLRDAPRRRVVSTNRSIRKHTILLALDWMGALLRGLKRHPVSSLCDEGGLSSVLAGFLTTSPTSKDDDKRHTKESAAVPRSNGEIHALLVSQVTHLQSESTAQRQQIERVRKANCAAMCVDYLRLIISTIPLSGRNAQLQGELDARLKAVQTCGKELVALRRELRAKDEKMDEMEAALDKVAERERLQMEQLQSTRPNGGVLDSKLHQQFTLLLAKCKALEQEHKETTQSLALYHDLEARYAELEQAHLVQAAHVQRLQREKMHVAELKKAVRLQEKVIRQFEDAVRVESAQERHSSISMTTTMSQPAAPTQVANGDSSDALLVAVRVKVLEEQLTTNARDAAREISRLNMRIMELEVNSRGASSNG